MNTVKFLVKLDSRKNPSNQIWHVIIIWRYPSTRLIYVFWIYPCVYHRNKKKNINSQLPSNIVMPTKPVVPSFPMRWNTDWYNPLLKIQNVNKWSTVTSVISSRVLSSYSARSIDLIYIVGLCTSYLKDIIKPRNRFWLL